MWDILTLILKKLLKWTEEESPDHESEDDSDGEYILSEHKSDSEIEEDNENEIL